jgi:ketosteroid isomerase-like protein
LRIDQNRRTIEKIYAAFAAGDVAVVLAAMAVDVDWESLGLEELPFGGNYRGVEGVARFFDAVAAQEEPLEFEVEEFVVNDTTVVALGHEEMRVHSTGRTYRSPWAQVWTLRAGKVTKFRAYMDTAAMRAAHEPQ